MTTPSTTKAPFDWRASLELAERILGTPPDKDFIKRPELLPTVVFRAAFPVALCREANATSRRAFASSKWTHAGIKKKLWTRMKAQATPWLKYRWAWPLNLEGCRPQVIAVKFSSHPNDEGSNPGKAAIDMLTCRKLLDGKTGRYTKHRMGLLLDDRRSVVDQYHWWEFLPKAHLAFVLIEVRV